MSLWSGFRLIDLSADVDLSAILLSFVDRQGNPWCCAHLNDNASVQELPTEPLRVSPATAEFEFWGMNVANTLIRASSGGSGASLSFEVIEGHPYGGFFMQDTLLIRRVKQDGFRRVRRESP